MSVPLTVARGTTRLLGGVLVAKVLDFAFYLLLARHLGVAAFGLYTFALSFTLLFNIVADFGFSGILAREVTRAPERLRVLLGDALRLKVALAVITFAASLGIARATGAPAGAMPLIAAMTAGMLLNSTALLFDVLLKTSGRSGAAGIAQIGQSATALVAGVGLLAHGIGPLGGALAYLVASISHLAGNAWFSRDLWRVPREGRVPGEAAVEPERWRERLRLWREALPLALSGVFIAIYFRIDAVMLQALRGEQAVGLYGGIYRMFEAAAPICGAYHSVLFPSLVRAAQGKGNWVGSLCQQSLRMLLLSAIGYSAFVAVESERIVGLILGPDYAQAAPGLAILIWATPPALMSTTLLWALAAVGRQAMGTWAVGVTALVNVGLNLVLIPRLSFMGASMATVVSEVLCFLMLCLAFRRGITPLRLIEMVWRPAVAALALGATLSAADPLLPAGARGLAVAAMIAIAAYLTPLIGLGAVGRREARLFIQILPEAGRRWFEPRVTAPSLEIPPTPPLELRREERRSLTARLGEKGMRNLLRIAQVRARLSIFSALYTRLLRLRGVDVGQGCLFTGPIEIIGDPRRITIGDSCIINRGACLWTHDYGPGHGRIEIQAGTALGRGVTINSYVEITIGAGSGLGDGCYVQDNDHGTEPGTPFLKQPIVGRPIWIGEDVWIGAHSIVLKGVTIGDHAVIGAGSVVVKPIPPEVVAVGCPCRPVKSRGALSSAA